MFVLETKLLNLCEIHFK